MPKLFDRVKVNIATTGTGDVTFGAVSSNAFLTPSEAGCADGDTVRYVIVDGTDFEEGIGTIASSVATMARTTVTKSKIGGTAGTTKLDLSGTAVLVLVASAADIVNKANVTTVGNALLTAADAAAVQTAAGASAVGKALFTAEDEDAVLSELPSAYSKANILGTVSQSSGVPTGAIIETGSNANGSYTKYADGTLICSAIINSGSLTIANSFLGGFRSDAQAWTFPVSFVGGSPAVSIVPTGISAFGVSLSSVTTSTSGFVYTAVTSQSSATRQAGAIAIGRWF
jgi:hypothetical protein